MANYANTLLLVGTRGLVMDRHCRYRQPKPT
jgi:hypothetical protein